MSTITRDNFNTAGTKLTRSTNARGNTPNGNVYIDVVTDTIQLIDVSELAITSAEANGLNTVDKVQALALYFFLLQEVDIDPLLQQYRFMMDAVPNRMGRLVGATAFLNGVKLAVGDEAKLANSGFTEFALDGSIDSVFHGVKALNSISSTGQPFYQLVQTPVTATKRQAVSPIDFSNLGQINDVIKTFTNGGSDFKAYALILGVRDFGFTVAETSSIDTGVTELGAYSQGYGIGNTLVSELSTINEVDVYGAGIVSPYNGLAYHIDVTPNAVSGFNEGTGSFTDNIVNTGSASLIQIRAWMDKLMQQDVDVNTGTDAVTFLPKRAEPLYTINANGKLVTRKGLFLANLSASDQQQVIFTDDVGSTFTYPFSVGIEILLSGAWFADTSQFYRIMYNNGGGVNDDFDTSGAVTATDGSSNLMSGDNTDTRISNTPDADGNRKLILTYDYDGNSEATLVAGVNKDMVIRIGGGTTSKAKVVPFTIKRQSLISIDATTDSETN